MLTVASATESPGNGEGDREETLEELRKQIDELRKQNFDLLREILELEKALAAAEKDPTVPIPRRPIIIVTQPLIVEIEAGSRRTVEFDLQNLTTDIAHSVITTADLSDAKGIAGFFMDNNNNINTMGSRNKKTL